MTFPTRGNNILDIFLTNCPSAVAHCNILPGISDHHIVIVKSSVSVSSQHPPKRKIYLWNRVDCVEVQIFFAHFNEHFLNYSINTPIDHLWRMFKNACIECMDNIIPSKFSSTRFHQPWITTNIKHLCKCKQRMFNKARASGSPSDWSQYKSLKKITQQACREAHRSYILWLIDPIAKSNNKNLWSYIKSKQINHTGVPPLFYNGRTITDSKEKANTLINHFSSVFTDEDVYTVPTLNNDSYPDIQPITTQVLDVYHHLTSLQSHKAPGPDNIPPMLLKIASSEVSLSLTLMFNASIHQGQLP